MPHAIIIGAGASGLLCAITAARRGVDVLVIEQSRRIGRKILASGGGRCNFTNRSVTPANYISRNPHFCRSALARFTTDHMLDVIHRHGIRFEERTHGRLFCLDSAATLNNALIGDAKEAGVAFMMNTEILGVRRGDRFLLETRGGVLEAASVVVATGGASYEAIGGNTFALTLARRFGLTVVPPSPALTPLLHGPRDRQEFGELSGISLPVGIAIDSLRFIDDLLFTWQGLSGPAALQASNYWRRGDSLTVDFLPGLDAAEFLLSRKARRALIGTILSEVLPARLAQALCRCSDVDGRINQLPNATLRSLGSRLNAWTFTPHDKDGFDKAEAMLGGVDTDVLDSRSMEVRTIPGLHFIGEAVDVTGQLGGYNLHWAWASGAAAGNQLSVCS